MVLHNTLEVQLEKFLIVKFYLIELLKVSNNTVRSSSLSYFIGLHELSLFEPLSLGLLGSN